MLAKLMSYFLLGLIRVLTGAPARWTCCLPKAEQRIYFANHQSHADFLRCCCLISLATLVATHLSGLAPFTGANGLLDRVGALCFAAPVLFHSVRWKFGL